VVLCCELPAMFACCKNSTGVQKMLLVVHTTAASSASGTFWRTCRRICRATMAPASDRLDEIQASKESCDCAVASRCTAGGAHCSTHDCWRRACPAIKHLGCTTHAEACQWPTGAHACALGKCPREVC
jgi:hypothetical protein